MYQAPPRVFVPADFNPEDIAQIELFCQSLLGRSIESTVELEKWLCDVSELTSVIDEFGTRRYIDKSCNTESAHIERAFLFYAETIEPKFKPFVFAFQKKFLASPYSSKLQSTRYQMLIRRWQAEVEVFRDENVPTSRNCAKSESVWLGASIMFGLECIAFRAHQSSLSGSAAFPARTHSSTSVAVNFHRRPTLCAGSCFRTIHL